MPAKSPSKPRKTAPKLLSGGNPQIPKGEGDAPVQAFIEAMPEWKRDIGRRIDEIIVCTVPGVRKAVKWNTPFFGVGEVGYFTAFHCFDKYVKVTFFRGTSLEPLPPGASSWIRQAAALPGVGGGGAGAGAPPPPPRAPPPPPRGGRAPVRRDNASTPTKETT